MKRFWHYRFAIFGTLFFSLLFFLPQLRLLVFLPPLFFFLFFAQSAKSAKGAVLGFAGVMFLSHLAISSTLRPDADAWGAIYHFVSPEAARWLPFLLFLFWILAAAWLSLPFALFSFLFWRLKRDIFSDVFLFACLWVGAEWLRAKIFFGFTWMQLGYWLFDAFPVFGIPARFLGVSGLSFFTVLLAGVTAYAAFDLPKKQKSEHKRIALAGSLALLAVVFLAALSFLAAKKERPLWQNAGRPGYALQSFLPWGEIPKQAEVANGFWLPESYARLIWQIPQTPGAIIILPEEVLPAIDLQKELYQWTQAERGRELLRRRLDASFLMVGQPIQTSGKIFNAFVIADGSPESKLYVKNKLFPFVEYAPFGGEAIKNAFPQTLTFFSRTGEIMPKETALGVLGIFSCVELLFPDLVYEQVRKGATLLLSGGSEIAWGAQVWKEDLLISRFHAAASKRFLIRAMKQGYSAVINPLGETITVSDGNSDTLLRANVDLVSEKTPITRIGENGMVLLFLIFGATVVAFRKKFPL